MSWLITAKLVSNEGIPWDQIPSNRKWTPAQITTALWLDAADAATLYDATSGGNLVVSGGAVARWNDKSGNSRNATQASASLRPTVCGGVDGTLIHG